MRAIIAARGVTRSVCVSPDQSGSVARLEQPAEDDQPADDRAGGDADGALDVALGDAVLAVNPLVAEPAGCLAAVVGEAPGRGAEQRQREQRRRDDLRQAPRLIVELLHGLTL